MITEWILNIFLAMIDGLVSLFPSFSLPDWDAPSQSLAAVANMNRVFPVCTLILCIIAAVALNIALYAWEFVQFIYHQFWGAS